MPFRPSFDQTIFKGEFVVQSSPPRCRTYLFFGSEPFVDGIWRREIFDPIPPRTWSPSVLARPNDAVLPISFPLLAIQNDFDRMRLVYRKVFLANPGNATSFRQFEYDVAASPPNPGSRLPDALAPNRGCDVPIRTFRPCMRRRKRMFVCRFQPVQDLFDSGSSDFAHDASTFRFFGLLVFFTSQISLRFRR